MDTHTYKPVDKVQEHVLMSSLNFLNISRIFFFLVVDTPGTGSITGYITQPFKQCQQLKKWFYQMHGCFERHVPTEEAAGQVSCLLI